jgi:hypothetical protein
MRTKTIVAGIIALAVVIGALSAAWYLTHQRPPEYCQLSDRPIHPHMLTVVRVKDKKRYACCARCALTYQEQTGIPTDIVEVTDYISGRPLDATKAYFASGSRVEPCCPPPINREEGRMPYMRMFDRCSPSLLAFADRNEAQAFIAKNGGTLTTLSELENQAKSRGLGVSHD